MQLSHLAHDVARTIITQEPLIKQTVLICIIELKPTSLLAAQDSSESFINQSLGADGQILLVVIVMGYDMVRALEQLDVLFDVLDVELLGLLSK